MTPIIVSNTYYEDDIERVFSGAFAWHELGRYLATITSVFQSNNIEHAVDIGVLTWFLSGVLIIFGAYVLYCHFNHIIYKKESIVISIFTVANPFLLQNLLYKFDSIGMSLSLFFSILSFSIPIKHRFSFVIQSLLLFLVLNLYQPFINFYIGLIGLQVFLKYLKKSGIDSVEILKSLIPYAIAIILYQLQSIILPAGGSRATIINLDHKIFITIIENINLSYIPFIEFFYPFWFFSIPAIISFISILIFALFKNSENGVFGILGLVLIYVSSIGAMSLLESQFNEPRGLPYFPIIASLIILTYSSIRENFIYLSIVPLIFILSFSSKVAISHRIQADFERPIFYDISTKIYKFKELEVYSIGSVPLSPFVYKITENTPFNAYLNRDAWRTSGRLREYVQNINFEWSVATGKTTEYFTNNYHEFTMYEEENPYYRIYLSDSSLYIHWVESDKE
ncbi:glucosyltransferase domain-containing protein [Salinibius halmophilus]|uniref:glucosyltransferase domain-containing protein n=1 Tax=Salinibius halmophilus TaxID=1853216 RepID=UPI001314F29B|nr:glucosyltransferase domain-containing protein [Salinibius halmophilus]